MAAGWFAGMDEVTREAQALIHQNQHPQDCQDRDFLLWEWYNSGMGAEVHFLGKCMACCMTGLPLPWPAGLHCRRQAGRLPSFCIIMPWSCLVPSPCWVSSGAALGQAVQMGRTLLYSPDRSEGQAAGLAC